MNPIDPRTGRVVPVWTSPSTPRTPSGTGLQPGSRSASPLPFGMPGSGPAAQGVGTRAPRQPLHATLAQPTVLQAAWPTAAAPSSAAQVPPLTRGPLPPGLDESCQATLADVWRLIDDGFCVLLASQRLQDGTMGREIGVASPDYLAAVDGHEGDIAADDGESAHEYQVLVIEREGQVASIEVHPSFEPSFKVSYESAGGACDAPGVDMARQILDAVPPGGLGIEDHFKAILRARLLLEPRERWTQKDMQEAAGLSRSRARELRKDTVAAQQREAADYLASQRLSDAQNTSAGRHHLLCVESRRRGLEGWENGVIADLSGASKHERETERHREARMTPDTQAVAAFIEATAGDHAGESADDRAHRVLAENDRRQAGWKSVSMFKGARLSRWELEHAQIRNQRAQASELRALLDAIPALVHADAETRYAHLEDLSTRGALAPAYSKRVMRAAAQPRITNVLSRPGPVTSP